MTISLDAALHIHGRSGLADGPSLHAFLAAPAPDVLPDLTALRAALPELLDGLGDDEQFVLGWRFGLIDGRPRTLGEIATLVAACGTPLNHNDVYTIQRAALATLRRPEIEVVIAAVLHCSFAQSAPSLLARRDLTTVRVWLATLPESLARARPRLGLLVWPRYWTPWVQSNMCSRRLM